MKKLKSILLALVIVPCVLVMTACTKSISVSEYNKKVNIAGNKYLKIIEDTTNDFGYTMSKTTKNTWTKKVKYSDDKGEEHEISKPFETIIKDEQIFEKDSYKDEAGKERQNLRVTTTRTTIEKGFKTSDDGLGIESYENETVDTVVYTLVANLETTDDLYSKAYRSQITTKNGEEEVNRKQVYTYDGRRSSLSEDIAYLMDNIYQDIVLENFFASTTSYSSLGDIEYFENDVDAYGFVFNYILNNANSDYQVTYSEANATIDFVSDLPSQISASSLYKRNEYFNGENYQGQENYQSVLNANLDITYSANTITTPEGFEEAELLSFAVNQISLLSFSITF